tara:strand:+ start:53 stop:226 length:174 start_codon:yes stop_codon:yes gene_type:complete
MADKTYISNCKTDNLYRELDLENQWYAMYKILDYLNEKQKIEVRKFIKQLKKESEIK